MLGTGGYSVQVADQQWEGEDTHPSQIQHVLQHKADSG